MFLHHLSCLEWSTSFPPTPEQRIHPTGPPPHQTNFPKGSRTPTHLFFGGHSLPLIVFSSAISNVLTTDFNMPCLQWPCLARAMSGKSPACTVSVRMGPLLPITAAAVGQRTRSSRCWGISGNVGALVAEHRHWGIIGASAAARPHGFTRWGKGVARWQGIGNVRVLALTCCFWRRREDTTINIRWEVGWGHMTMGGGELVILAGGDGAKAHLAALVLR